MNPIRVVLVDDHALFRAGVRSLLARLEGIEVVGEASDGREALKLIRRESPDVAILDISMPGLRGLEAAKCVRETSPGVRVVILSMHSSDEYVLRALQSGASGYLLKDSLAGELEIAIRAVARGGTYLTPAVARRVAEGYIQVAGSNPAASGGLTERQQEILQLIAEGHSNREIGQVLNLSSKTVDTHRTQIMQKLGIHDVTGLVRYAVRVGLVSSEG
ncbi:MAG: response regulator [Thermoanaerobaculia bacterium]